MDRDDPMFTLAERIVALPEEEYNAVMKFFDALQNCDSTEEKEKALQALHDELGLEKKG